MGTSRTITEKQHENAKRLLQKQVDQLAKEGVDKKNFKRNVAWRKLDAKVRQIGARVRKLDQLDALEAELQQRKTENNADEE